MKIFNRKKDQEQIEALEKIKQEVVDLLKEQGEQLTILTENQEKALHKIEQQEKELDNLQNRLTQQEKENQKIIETTNQLYTKFEKQTKILNEKYTYLENKNKELLEKTQKQPQEIKETETKNNKPIHLYRVRNELAEPYQKIILQGEQLSTGKRQYGFNIKDVINIKNNLQEYHKNNITLTEIGKKHNINPTTIHRLVWNIEEGNFDKVIEEYNNPTTKKTTPHKRILGKAYRKLYKKPNIKEDNYLYDGNTKIPYTLTEIQTIKNRIHNTKQYPTITSIFKGMEFKDYYGKILIWNIEEGTLDKILKNGEQKKTHHRTIPHSLHKPQRNLRLGADGSIMSNGHKLKYNITDIIALKEKIPNTKQYPNLKSISEGMNISEMTVGSVVWNIEEGYYDEILKQYEEIVKPVIEKKLTHKDKRHHIYKLSQSYQVPLKQLKVDNDGLIYNKINQKLPYNIYDIMEMKKRIYSSKKNNISLIYSDFGFNNQLGNKLVWNIEEGYFDNLIEEFNSRNYTYERKHNRLYIDGEDTHLTIDNCNIIIDCLVNDTNKPMAINRLIKTYPQTSPKYIRIIGEEYNNINLGKVLSNVEDRVDKVVVNNPQKRREQGLGI